MAPVCCAKQTAMMNHSGAGCCLLGKTCCAPVPTPGGVGCCPKGSVCVPKGPDCDGGCCPVAMPHCFRGRMCWGNADDAEAGDMSKGVPLWAAGSMVNPNVDSMDDDHAAPPPTWLNRSYVGVTPSPATRIHCCGDRCCDPGDICCRGKCYKQGGSFFWEQYAKTDTTCSEKIMFSYNATFGECVKGCDWTGIEHKCRTGPMHRARDARADSCVSGGITLALFSSQTGTCKGDPYLKIRAKANSRCVLDTTGQPTMVTYHGPT